MKILHNISYPHPRRLTGTTVENIDYLDRDLSDLSDLSVRRVVLIPSITGDHSNQDLRST